MAKKGLTRRVGALSPENAFIRTGVLPELFDPLRARRIGTRFLSSVWEKNASGKFSRRALLPTARQRVFGARHSEKGLREIYLQAEFAARVFAQHLAPRETELLIIELKKRLSRTTLSISHILSRNSVPEYIRKKGKHSQWGWIRKEGVELFNAFRRTGAIYRGWASENKRAFVRKGFEGMPVSHLTPIHETMHLLQQLKIIKVDVPFAEAVDRFFGLETGVVKINPKIRNPSKADFDSKPRVLEKGETQNFDEPEWSYPVGRRIGQWLHLNFPGKTGWAYLYLRCMGAPHLRALSEIQRKH